MAEKDDDDDETHNSYLIVVPEETEAKGNEVLNDMEHTRMKIQFKQGKDMGGMFNVLKEEYNDVDKEQISLGMTEDRRETLHNSIWHT